MNRQGLRKAWGVLKKSTELFLSHDTYTHGAALSYYMVFSIVPILLIVISVAGAILGPDATQGEVKRQLQGLLGSDNAGKIQETIKAAYQPGHKWLATALAIIVLLIGATSVFGQLRTALNTIWDVKPKARTAVMRFFMERLFSMGMIACLSLLLLVSLAIHTGLEAFTYYLSAYMSVLPTWVLTIIDSLLSFALTSLLFAILYKFMSDARLKWGSVWLGAVLTSLFFTFGKYLIGLYIGKSGVASGYGAAGSVILVLVWVYYSSQIVFFGAEFIRALAIEKGVSLDPVAIPAKE